MALDLIAELEAVLDALAGATIEYALCGGLAVAVHGHPRATMDIDIMVPPDQLAMALRAVQAIGFDLPTRTMTFGLRTGMPREIQRVSKNEPTTGGLLSLDLLVVGAALADAWADRISVRWRDRDLSIVSRGGLIAMKRLAGRPQDLADIAILEGATDDEA